MLSLLANIFYNICFNNKLTNLTNTFLTFDSYYTRKVHIWFFWYLAVIRRIYFSIIPNTLTSKLITGTAMNRIDMHIQLSNLTVWSSYHSFPFPYYLFFQYFISRSIIKRCLCSLTYLQYTLSLYLKTWENISVSNNFIKPITYFHHKWCSKNIWPKYL